MELGFIPNWMAGETLYSWCSRFHRAHGTSANRTGIVLFGNPSAAKARLMPKNLGHYAEVTGGALGSSAYLLQRRCSVGAFSAFLEKAARERLFATLEGRAQGESFRSLCMSKMLRLNTLRYCVECAASDLSANEQPRWLVEHQLPAVFACSHHGTMLTTVEADRTGNWSLPMDRQREIQLIGRAAHLPVLKLLSRLSQQLLSCSSIDVNVFCEHVSDLLLKRGVLRPDMLRDGAQIDPDVLHAHFRKTALHRWLRHAFPLANVTRQGGWIADALHHRPRDRATTYLFLWVFVYAEHSPRDTLHEFLRVASGSSKVGVAPTGTRTVSPLAEQLELFALPRRGALRERQDFPSAMPNEIAKALCSEPSIARIVDRFEISRRRVKAWLKFDPQVEVQRQSTRVARIVEQARRYLEAHPDATRAEMHGAVPPLRWLALRAPDSYWELLAGRSKRRRPAFVLRG